MIKELQSIDCFEMWGALCKENMYVHFENISKIFKCRYANSNAVENHTEKCVYYVIHIENYVVNLLETRLMMIM